ncbi:hypothetical protein O9993_06820 [Vibrio lentus]|nr:hypothetical protein [Vibrio lentus]
MAWRSPLVWCLQRSKTRRWGTHFTPAEAVADEPVISQAVIDRIQQWRRSKPLSARARRAVHCMHTMKKRITTHINSTSSSMTVHNVEKWQP